MGKGKRLHPGKRGWGGGARRRNQRRESSKIFGNSQPEKTGRERGDQGEERKGVKERGHGCLLKEGWRGEGEKKGGRLKETESEAEKADIVGSRRGCSREIDKRAWARLA